MTVLMINNGPFLLQNIANDRTLIFQDEIRNKCLIIVVQWHNSPHVRGNLCYVKTYFDMIFTNQPQNIFTAYHYSTKMMQFARLGLTPLTPLSPIHLQVELLHHNVAFSISYIHSHQKQLKVNMKSKLNQFLIILVP